ncbi:uncharacterized protein [Palaemon carinicauda]|uniref:uncharacterized protein n=1 Tax=Palaemon carinicauda TaxID=392227 RepID=UPI0035B61175
MPGPTGHAKRCITVGTPASAWRLMIDKFIIQHIKNRTIAEAPRQNKSQNFSLNDEELEAFTFMYARGVAVWNRFIDNCIACYKPGPNITIDEQLFPSKARCPITQFMASKPDKYGQKYWLAVDKENKYLVNGFPYVGKEEHRPIEERVADYVIMRPMDPYLNKGRNVTTDNYFTSVNLAKQLKKKGTSIIGTMNKIRR